MKLNSAAIDALQQEWRLFKDHHPAGAYLPVGQMDGDCRKCGYPWPCPPAREALERALHAQLVDESMRAASDARPFVPPCPCGHIRACTGPHDCVMLG